MESFLKLKINWKVFQDKKTEFDSADRRQAIGVIC